MRVILRENIESLGKKGDIVNVARGYGRNYLIPKNMATEVTSRNMKMIEIEQKTLQRGFEKERASYQEFLDRLSTTTLTFTRKTSEKDVIFGSVSATDIKDALDSLGLEVEKKKILLDEPIKRLGNYTVPIKVFHEERAAVKIQVVREGAPGVREEKKQQPALPEEKEEVLEPTAVEVEEEIKKEGPSVQEGVQAVAAEEEEPLEKNTVAQDGEETGVSSSKEEQEDGFDLDSTEVDENTGEAEPSSEESEEISRQVEKDAGEEKHTPQETTEDRTAESPVDKAKKENK